MLIRHSFNGEKSKIFSDIYNRYQEIAEEYEIKICESDKSISQEEITHYHRPQKDIYVKEKSVCTLHFDPYDLYQGIHFNHLVNCLSRYNKIICLNSRQIDILSEHFDNLVLIEHGLESNFKWSLKKRDINNGQSIVIGIFSKKYRDGRKGERYLLKLARCLNRKAYHFLFVGTGWTSVAFKLRVMGFKVTCMHDIAYQLYPEVYRLVHIVFIGSLFEGGPACIQEAVASNTWIVGSRIGSVEDYVEDGLGGKIISFDVTTDAESIEFLREKIFLGETPSFKRKPISWEENFKKHIEIYSGLS